MGKQKSPTFFLGGGSSKFFTIHEFLLRFTTKRYEKYSLPEFRQMVQQNFGENQSPKSSKKVVFFLIFLLKIEPFYIKVLMESRIYFTYVNRHIFCTIMLSRNNIYVSTDMFYRTTIIRLEQQCYFCGMTSMIFFWFSLHFLYNKADKRDKTGYLPLPLKVANRWQYHGLFIYGE